MGQFTDAGTQRFELIDIERGSIIDIFSGSTTIIDRSFPTGVFLSGNSIVNAGQSSGSGTAVITITWKGLPQSVITTNLSTDKNVLTNLLESLNTDYEVTAFKVALTHSGAGETHGSWNVAYYVLV